MNTFYSISSIGELYIPEECRDAVFARGSVKLFAQQELQNLDRILTHIKRGGTAVVEGLWDDITDVMEYIQRHKRELSSSNSDRGSRSRRRNPRDNHKQVRDAAISQLMCWVNKDGLLQVKPNPDLPFLLELIGEEPRSNQDCPFLVPVATVQRIQSALEESYPINALDASLIASENVLAPRSQDTIECFQEALQYVQNSDPKTDLVVAEIGCGSGCLTLLAHQELQGNSEIYASDIQPEAIATTKINVQRLLKDSGKINILPSGDLFEPFPVQQFDIIIFNAPWVVARVRNRSELSIHDEKQQTLKRFFDQLPNYLKPDGLVLLGYADASGPKAIANLETIIEDSGFVTQNIFKRRVATHRSKRKWEHIQVYLLEKL